MGSLSSSVVLILMSQLGLPTEDVPLSSFVSHC